jgi:hypothetical protein
MRFMGLNMDLLFKEKRNKRKRMAVMVNKAILMRALTRLKTRFIHSEANSKLRLRTSLNLKQVKLISKYLVLITSFF